MSKMMNSVRATNILSNF